MKNKPKERWYGEHDCVVVKAWKSYSAWCDTQPRYNPFINKEKPNDQ